MTGISDTSGSAPPAVRVHTWAECAIVLGGFAAAALWTVADHALGAGTGFAGPLWTIAVAWAVAASFALAIRRGLRYRDWSAFRGHRFPDNAERVDHVSQTGQYAWMPIAEEHERLMRGG